MFMAVNGGHVYVYGGQRYAEYNRAAFIVSLRIGKSEAKVIIIKYCAVEANYDRHEARSIDSEATCN